MSLRQRASYQIPEEPQRVASAAFPKGCLCLRLADGLGILYRDEQFAALFPKRGQPAAAPGRLAMATVLQFAKASASCPLPSRSTSLVRWDVCWRV